MKLTTLLSSFSLNLSSSLLSGIFHKLSEIRGISDGVGRPVIHTVGKMLSLFRLVCVTRDIYIITQTIRRSIENCLICFLSKNAKKSRVLLLKSERLFSATAKLIIFGFWCLTFHRPTTPPLMERLIKQINQ